MVSAFLLREPDRSRFDWNFRIHGTDVRVHPLFWVFTLCLASSIKNHVSFLAWIAVVFVSIVVHEFGHVAAMRWAGGEGRVVLHAAGGLAIPTHRYREGWFARVMVALGGPLAQVLVAGVVTGIVVWILGGSLSTRTTSMLIPRVTAELGRTWLYWSWYDAYYVVHYVVNHLLYVNIFWALINLLPVVPLDGGSMAQAIWERLDPVRGRERALYLSFVTAVLVTLLAVARGKTYLAFFFGTLAVGCVQAAQSRKPAVPRETKPYAFRRY